MDLPGWCDNKIAEPIWLTELVTIYMYPAINWRTHQCSYCIAEFFVRIIIVSYYLKLHRYIVDANLPASSFVVVVFINIYNERRWESICIYMDIYGYIRIYKDVYIYIYIWIFFRQRPPVAPSKTVASSNIDVPSNIVWMKKNNCLDTYKCR